LRKLHLLFILIVFPALIQFGSPNQQYTTSTTLATYFNTHASTVSIGVTTLSQLATSTYSVASGTIPASYTSDISGQQICFYVPYSFHVDSSVHRIVGVISGSSEFNYYLMSSAQYSAFASTNPSCGSSFSALMLDYSKRQFNIDWSPNPGDYYILLENTSTSTITYTIQVSAVMNQIAPIDSTTLMTQTLISTILQLSWLSTQPTTSSEGPTISIGSIVPLVLGIVVVVAVLGALFRSRHRRAKRDATRMY